MTSDPSWPGPLTPGSDEQRSAVRAWRILHACESVDCVLPVAELQRNAGMRPTVVLPTGAVPLERLPEQSGLEPRTSLLTAWNNVRNWRKVLLETDPACDSEIVHAHSFSSGMAGVRNCPAVVYQLSSFIEDLATEQQGKTAAESATWLSRSFRVAEQFVLTRAAAVVVSSNSMRNAAIERGTPQDCVFVIPAPLDAEDESGTTKARDDSVIRVFASLGGVEWRDCESLLKAFASVMRTQANAVLDLLFSGEMIANIRECATTLGIAHHLQILDGTEQRRQVERADIVISLPAHLEMHQESSALSALRNGVALLAADVDVNRDATPDGRGCLWFERGDEADLARRLVFLIEHSDLRIALAQGGRKFVHETRSPAALASSYDRLYRHAFARRRTGNLQAPGAQLRPIAAS